MAKVVNLEKKDLERIRSYQEKTNNIVISLGQLELQKARIYKMVHDLETENANLGNELTKKYGEGDIDINKGTITIEEKKSTNK